MDPASLSTRSLWRSSAVALACLLVPLGIACGGEEEAHYEVRGRVVAVEDGTLVVHHEPIPGYMPAMEMSLPLAAGLTGAELAAGDKISFALHRTGSDLEVRAITELPADTTLDLGDLAGDEHRDMDHGAMSGGAWEGWDATPVPVGLPSPPPSDSALSADKIALGHALFMDKRLSFDGSRSCYSCHQNALGNADGREKALGAGDKPLGRNTPTIWNVAYHDALYWDGRAGSLEAQALGAWRGGNMGVGADNLDAKAAEIGALPEYREQFEAAFGLGDEDAVLPAHVAQAISEYERTLLCGDTAFDRGELGEAAARGRALFEGAGGCVACHAAPLFANGTFHAVGVGGTADPGRGKVTEQATDDYRFRTPTLRNVAQTAPYFHDGSVASLEEAVRIMASGGVAGEVAVDPLLIDRELDDDQIGDLVAFLETLTCTGSLEVIGDQAVAGITP